MVLATVRNKDFIKIHVLKRFLYQNRLGKSGPFVCNVTTRTLTTITGGQEALLLLKGEKRSLSSSFIRWQLQGRLMSNGALSKQCWKERFGEEWECGRKMGPCSPLCITIGVTASPRLVGSKAASTSGCSLWSAGCLQETESRVPAGSAWETPAGL